jgi:hypothetical protein
LTHIHVWYGRVLVTAGIVNGYFGLVLADNNMVVKIAYVVVGSVMWLAWMGTALLGWMRGKRGKEVKVRPTIVRVKDERY